MLVKGEAITGFPFALVNKFTGDPITSGTVSGYYILDGGAQTAIAGTPVHEGNGQWTVNLTATETDGDVLGLLFLHDDALPVAFTIKMSAEPYGEIVTGTPSEVAICNLALARLGEAKITSLTDTTNRASLCNLMYEHVRDKCLDRIRPNFAVRRTALAQLEDAPTFGYDYAYQIPTNVLRVLEASDSDAEWKREGDTVITDETTFSARMLYRERDTTKWTPLFTEAVIAMLAADLSGPLTKVPTFITAKYELAEVAVVEAQAIEGVEGTKDQLESDALLRIRY
ncbi:MAG: hypothetical protein ABFD60_07790 [Bryobacteraceae bacterium]